MRYSLFTLSFLMCAASVFGSWHIVESPVSSNLRSISFVDFDSVFVAGSDGTILQYDGEQWLTMDSGIVNNLNSISMINAEEGWAVGAEGAIVRFADNEWSVFSGSSDERTYNSVYAHDPDNVYFLSYHFLEGTAVHHWNGEDMMLLRSFSDNLSGLVVETPESIWVAGGNGTVCHYNGTSWDFSYSSLPETVRVFGICLKSDGYPLITGVRLPGWDLDLIYEYDPDTGWIQLWSGYESRVMSIAINKTRGFATGARGRIVENTIFGWNEISTPVNRQINQVILPDTSEGWAVTDLGGILHYREASVTVEMNQNTFRGLDPFELNVSIRNPAPPYSGIMKLIMLEAYGVFFFWPSWTDEFDADFVTLAQGYDKTESVLSFTWPAGAGSGMAAFWSALLDTDNTILSYDIESFSWID